LFPEACQLIGKVERIKIMFNYYLAVKWKEDKRYMRYAPNGDMTNRIINTAFWPNLRMARAYAKALAKENPDLNIRIILYNAKMIEKIQ
jgi:hypothetical protein